MQLMADFHTHTWYSHGKGSIEDNVIAAINKGLKVIGITDHGFRHSLYNVRRSDFRYMQKDVRDVQAKYPQIQILLGLETNIQSNNGTIDATPKDVEMLQVVICGYHKMIHASNPYQFFSFWLPNMINSITKKTSAKRRVINTDAFISAMEKYPLDIISHPMYNIDIDLLEVAKVAEELGVFLELNGKKVSIPDKTIEEVLSKTNANFIVDSDAHSPDRVGEVSKPMAVIERIGIPVSRLANMDKVPILRSHKLRQNNNSGIIYE